MARIRSIKPEYWGDFETAQNLSRDARLLYIAMWNFCDEWARMAGDPRYVKGHCMPYDDDLTPDAIDALIDQLADAGNVVRYTANSAPYLWLPNLAKHQRLEPHKVPSRLPEPPDHDPSGSRADKSARNADSPETNDALQVAGSREQAAGGRGKTPPRAALELPDELVILRGKLEARKLAVRWDKLTPEQVSEMVYLVHVHGDGPLVKAALAAYQPNDPIAFAQGWLKHWKLLAPPGALSLVKELCSVHGTELSPSGTCNGCVIDAKVGDR